MFNFLFLNLFWIDFDFYLNLFFLNLFEMNF